jgi:hypothetical protein
MSFDSRLLQRVTVKRMAATGAVDDYGQPVSVEVTVATAVPASIQPRSARELALASGAGPVIGDHVGYLRPLAGLGSDCWIEVGTARYDIVAMPDAAGLGHHLELGLRRVG